LAGSFGSSPLTNAGGVIADMFPASQRGLATSLFAAAPMLGPVIGPIGKCFKGPRPDFSTGLTRNSWWFCRPDHRLALDRRRHGHIHRCSLDPLHSSHPRNLCTSPAS
jgi:hypothetical protein